MNSAETKAMTVEVSKEISAPVEKVFKAWTDPEHMKKWYSHQGGEININQDFRVGGKYNNTKVCDDMPATVSGTFLEIVPNKKLVYSWTNTSKKHYAKDTIVTVEFIDKGKTTQVIVKHTNFATQEAFSGHNMGWQEVLNRVAASFAS